MAVYSACATVFGCITLACALAHAALAPVEVAPAGPHTDASSNQVYIAVDFSIAEGWHIFWRNPGDSGQAPSITLAPARAAGPIVWPSPERLDSPPLASYGYSGHVTLPMPLVQNSPNNTDTIAAQVHWLACAQTCVPQSAEVHWSAKQLAQPGDNARIAQALEATPHELPQDARIQANIEAEGLLLTVSGMAFDAVQTATFYPDVQGGIDENQPKRIGRDAGRLSLRMAVGRGWQSAPKTIDGVLALRDTHGQTHSYQVHTPLSQAPFDEATPVGAVAAQPSPVLQTSAQGALVSFLQTIALACLGGMLLNLMPCVFPVLSIKILGYIKTSGTERARRRRQALLYALGNVLSLTLVGGMLLGLRAMGQSVGWGFQMQSPLFVMAMAQLMFVMGLSQLGWLSFGEGLVGVGQTRAQGHSDSAAFFTGVLTVIVATPCSAPFMGVATGAALSLPPVMGLVVFAALGTGVALPYLALCYIEPLAARLPRPGPWMLRLREATGLCLWASSLWLLWILGRQCGSSAMTAGLLSMWSVGTAAWAMRTWSARRLRMLACLVLVASALALAVWPCTRGRQAPRTAQAPTQALAKNEHAWMPYSAKALAAQRQARRPVFIDFTAAWCVSCQVNEALVLKTARIDNLFQSLHVARMKADWTQQDDAITQALAQFGRTSVPLYVYYPSDPKQAPVILPAILTIAGVVQAIEAAQAF